MTSATATETEKRPGAPADAQVREGRVWVWLVAVVVVSAAVRIVLARRMAAPWIMIDELVYSELAKSVGAHGHFLVRGVSSTGYGFVYPLLIAPAWRLFGPMPAVYAEAKAINSALMSLAAVPAYLLARRLLSVRLSLVVAALTVLVPSMVYTGTLMTENAFYPVFLGVALLLVVTLERPTLLRQAGLVAGCLLAFETRAQAVALAAAAATAPLLLALLERRGLRRGVRPFALLYALLAAVVLAALVETAARGDSPLAVLGAYRAATSSTYTAGGILHFFLYHLAELDLYLGVIPFAALVAVWLTPRADPPARRAFVAATLAVSFWLVAEVATFASQTSVDRIEERNVFYLAPFGLVALVGLAADGVVPTARRPVIAAAAAAAVLPVFIPYTRFITTSAVSDTLALLPWWWVQDHWIALGQVRWAALGAALAAGTAFVLVPRRSALALAALVGCWFVVTTIVAQTGRHGIERSSLASLWAGTHLAHPDWIDRRVGPGSSVALLWTGTTTPYPLWENEFFNRSLGTVYDLDGAARPDPLPATPVTRAASGRLVVPGGSAVAARYVLAPASADLGGELLAQDPVGMSLYRVNGPLVILSRVTGLYPGDTWSGPTVTYRRVDCTGGRLAVELRGDPSLFPRPQTVVARELGRVVGRATVAGAGDRTLRIPLRAGANGACVVRFDVHGTAVPARVEAGSTDKRRLGVHFLSFRYTT